MKSEVNFERLIQRRMLLTRYSGKESLIFFLQDLNRIVALINLIELTVDFIPCQSICEIDAKLEITERVTMAFLETKGQNSIAYIIKEELRVEEDDEDWIFYQQVSLFNYFLRLL